ncbi:DUF4190 domain-containing protein [Streptomyces sp. NPDC048442]|uniref:DUF4190 domain-containing protein n=1 Tax=Streptomyces sp. NPDC048442 TaxID=3154823 RepID=UPI00342197B4
MNAQTTRMNTQGTLMNTEGTLMKAHAGRTGLAGTAMVLGIIGLSTSVIFIGGLIGVVGLVLGIFALATAERTSNGTRPGRGKALTAVVTSALAIVVSVLVAIALLWYANKTQDCYRPDSFQQYTECVRHQLTGA